MCSVVGCDFWRHGTQRFKLPEDPERRLEWVQFLLEVNGQRLKESSWTDITICRHHFTSDCFENLTPTGSVQLKSGAVPSVCVKSEPDQLWQEPEETAEVTFQYDELKSCDSPSSYSEESGLSSTAAQDSQAPSEASDHFMSDYCEMIQKVENVDMIRKKAALLLMKGKYVVNEKRLLQLLSHKCPSCGSKVKTEKVTCGVVLILNQQCPDCDYRNQWKSQVNASVPTAEDQHLTEEVKLEELEVEVTPETQQTVPTDDNSSSNTGMSEIFTAIDEEVVLIDEEEEESSDEADKDSDDEDWRPAEELFLVNEEDTEDEEEEEDDEDLPFGHKHSELCTDCGKFFNNQKPHTCEHKIKPYSCNICGKRCASESALNTHSRIHDENYEYRCKYCELTYKTKVDKVTHEQIHITEGKPYKCPDCSETFATNKLRKIHLLDHRGPQQLKCHICGLEFTQADHLQRHLNVHTGERPFKCSECKRGFTQASHLKSHMRLHTGERPFKCQHCDKCFTHNVSLKSHVQRYHSSGSECEQKDKINKTANDTGDAQENGNKRGTGSAEEEHKEEKVQKKSKAVTKIRKKRSTGRPIGRPKRNSEDNVGETQGKRSNIKTAKAKVRKLKRKHSSDEDSEEEPTESDMSFDLTEEEEENSEEMTSSTSRSRGRAKNSDSDSDFDPEETKKKRYSSQNRGQNSGKRRGRPRKNQSDEDTEH